MEYQLIEVNGSQVQVKKEVAEQLTNFYDLKARIEVKEKQLKQELLEVMEANGIKSIDNELFRITYKAPSKRMTVDTQALKDQGIYDNFTKETAVKPSVTITLKNE